MFVGDDVRRPAYKLRQSNNVLIDKALPDRQSLPMRSTLRHAKLWKVANRRAKRFSTAGACVFDG